MKYFKNNKNKYDIHVTAFHDASAMTFKFQEVKTLPNKPIIVSEA